MAGIIERWNKFLNTTMAASFEALSLLAVRLVCGGGLAFVHGWSKLNNFNSLSESFPDPIKVGSPTLSLALAIFGEFVCGILVAIGCFTRISAVAPLFTMSVAILIVHAGDPYEKRELALLYAVGFLVILLKGAGPLSVDGLLRNKKSKSSI